MKLLILISTMLMTSQQLAAQEVKVTTSSGKQFVIDVTDDEKFWEVTKLIDGFFDHSVAEEGIVFELAVDKSPVRQFYQRRDEGDFAIMQNVSSDDLGDDEVRNYYAPLTPEEQADISYIVLTLADKPLTKLLGYRASLQKAGDRIASVHPLKFLYWVFSNDALKVGIRNVRNKGWVWKDFFGGLRDSLEKEANLGNMQPQFVTDFAGSLHLDPAQIQPSIDNHRWDELIEKLMVLLPYVDDSDPYDF